MVDVRFEQHGNETSSSTLADQTCEIPIVCSVRWMARSTTQQSLGGGLRFSRKRRVFRRDPRDQFQNMFVVSITTPWFTEKKSTTTQKNVLQSFTASTQFRQCTCPHALSIYTHTHNTWELFFLKNDTHSSSLPNQTMYPRQRQPEKHVISMIVYRFEFVLFRSFATMQSLKIRSVEILNEKVSYDNARNMTRRLLASELLTNKQKIKLRTTRIVLTSWRSYLTATMKRQFAIYKKSNRENENSFARLRNASHRPEQVYAWSATPMFFLRNIHRSTRARPHKKWSSTNPNTVHCRRHRFEKAQPFVLSWNKRLDQWFLVDNELMIASNRRWYQSSVRC